MYLKLGTPGHSIEVSQSRNVRITFWEKVTLLWPRNYPHLRMVRIMLILFPAFWDLFPDNCGINEEKYSSLVVTA